MEDCIICNTNLATSETVAVKEKGIQTLIQASNERNDRKFEYYIYKGPLTVHKNCRKNYTRKTSITAEKIKSSNNTQNELNITKLRSCQQQFDFKSQCLICGEICEKKRASKKKYCCVTTLELKNKIIYYCEQRKDDWAEDVLRRVGLQCDLVASEARYHLQCLINFQRCSSDIDKGRPTSKNVLLAFKQLCLYLDERKESICQFSLNDLYQKFTDLANDEMVWSSRYFRQKIRENYQDEIIFVDKYGSPSVLCFKGSTEELVKNAWKNSTLTVKEQRKNIVELSAKILKEDVRSESYNLNQYPSASDIANGGVNYIPDNLQAFLSVLFGKSESDKKVISVANIIISAVRPRSFQSPLLFSIAIYLHRKFGSKNLLDLLHSLGFSDSYKEALKFEAAATTQHDLDIRNSIFHQFVFDNADCNVKTLDGYGTFHSMGGIICISPRDSLPMTENILRSNQIPKAAEIGSFGIIPIKPYKKSLSVLKTFKFFEPQCILKDEVIQEYKLKNCLWLSAFVFNFERKPSWNGYMAHTVSASFETSQVLPLPFINLDPGNLTTLNSALHFAITMSKKQGQNMCFVTFDQPLFYKAFQIVAQSEENSILKDVVVRLGGFHLLMSYLGAIGYIMDGSGIEELLNIIYAKNSLPSILNGHSYARALRAHFLVQLALMMLILKSSTQSESDQEILKSHYLSLNPPVLDISSVKQLLNELTSKLEATSVNSRTAKLWKQYIELVDLAKLFITAERTGDLELHLYAIQQMHPYFYASGHLPYAKAIQLYLQKMTKLKDTMSDADYVKFKKNFTVRRTDHRFWSGVWTDMTIEQVLMRSLKSEGGLTRGRGITNSTLTKWVLSMPQCVMLSDALENFANIKPTYSEQHTEMRISREKRDCSDLDKLIDWLNMHDPFAHDNSFLVSLSTGLVASEDINCDKAKEVGEKIRSQTFGKSFGDIKFKRNDKVKSLGFMHKTVKVHGQVGPINPSQLFNRILCSYKTEETLKECFNHELSPYPLALFHDGLLRKTNKSALVSFLDKLCNPIDKLPDHTAYVIDGGFLLHKVLWQYPSLYKEIYQQYVNYINFHYGKDVTVVFDGYKNYQTSIKYQEQVRRTSNKLKSPTILFNDQTVTTLNQGIFLSNAENKDRFITALSEKLKEHGIRVIQTDADADVILVKSVLQIIHDNVTLVGEDTDLLILLLHYTQRDGIFMLRPGKSNSPDKITDMVRINKQEIWIN